MIIVADDALPSGCHDFDLCVVREGCRKSNSLYMSGERDTFKVASIGAIGE